MNRDKNLVWIDLEMTGLNPEVDIILELACVITDSNLNVLDSGIEHVISWPKEKLDLMSKVVRQMHEKSGLIDRIASSNTNLSQVEKELLDLIGKYCNKNTALIAGNTVWQDRNFLAKYMPSIVDYCFYRVLDVSTVKELAARWYPESQYKKFEKSEKHRAMQDVLGSIEELKHFRKYFFV